MLHEMIRQNSPVMAALVGIIIVVHNRKNDLIRLIQSLQRQDYYAYEILIIDNDSFEDLSEMQRLPGVEYLKLEENIGFVSGMTRGIQYLLSKNKYSHLWILDSDVQVAPTALSRLVAAFEVQADVGVAGCAIYNTYDNDLVVEAGADVDLRTGVVSARYCNERRPRMEIYLDVDFIASGGGGSLISVEALRATGLHDSRYHFLWEDTDFGLCLKKHGYRSVVVTNAVVYHPPFTEKRNPNIYAYYGVRNPLLTVAKYASTRSLPRFLLGNLSRYLRIALLMKFSGCRGFAGLTFKAIGDYVTGQFGKSQLGEIESPIFSDGSVDLSAERQVLILGTGVHDVIESAISAVRKVSSARITLVVQSYRQALFEDLPVDSVVTYDDHASATMHEYMRVGLVILWQKGCLINTELKTASPFIYFSRRVYDWDSERLKFHRSPYGVFSVWKPATAVVLGSILAFLLLPLVWVASLRHRTKHPVYP